MKKYFGAILLIFLWTNIVLSNEFYNVEAYKKDTLNKKIKIRDIKAGTLIKKISGSEEYEILPNMETIVNIKIDGMVSETKMEQVFINNSSDPIEAIYIFPINHNAAVNDMKFIVNNRIIETKIKEKSVAEKEYKKAKEDGKRASIVTQERPNIFKQSIANIMPNDTINVIISYVQNLKYENHEFKYRLPLTITPRYRKEPKRINVDNGLNPINSIINDKEKINPKYLDEKINYANNIKIKANINSGFKIVDIISSHKIDRHKINDSNFNISLKNGQINANQDFTLSYLIKEGDEPQISIFSATKNNEEYYMIMAMGPKDINDKQHISKEITFVIDRSGSMEGNNMESAKIAVIEALKKLKSNDTFNIISFSDSFKKFSYKPLLVNDKNIKQGIKFINDITAYGGTEALPALEWAMQEEHDASKIKMIIFITDGAVGYEDSVMRLIDEENVNEARFFPICIGYAPNSYLLQKVAEITRGSYTYIKNHGEITNKLEKLFNKIENPILSNIIVNFNQTEDYFPNPIKDLYLNEPLIIFCKSNSSINEIEFKGKNSIGDFNKKFNLNDIVISQESAIPELWARKKIAYLMDNYRLSRDIAIKDDIKSQIIDISKSYNILSKFTSFIGIESEIVNKKEYLLSTKIGSQLPKNWKKSSNSHSQSSDYYMPETATNNLSYFLFGLFLLCTSIFLIRYNEKYS